MAKGRLSQHERRILDQMEAALDRDYRLRRRLWAVRLAWRLRTGWTTATVARGFFVTLAALASLILLVVAVATMNPGVIWAFVVTWSAVLLAGRGLKRHRADDRAGGPRPGRR